MAGRGVHFAITEDQRRTLEALPTDEHRIDYVTGVLEPAWDENYLQQTDKAWEALHRCLGDFPPGIPWFHPVKPDLGPFALPENHGTYPLKLCILGGKRLVADESRYVIRLIGAPAVADLVPALGAIDRERLWRKYQVHCRGVPPAYGDEDFERTWAYFDRLRGFFARMAGTGRSIIFTANR